MTEVELVATALATGPTAGLTDTARRAVHDLCAGLRETVRRRPAAGGGNSGDGGCGVRVLAAYEADRDVCPDVWRTRLLQVLRDSGAETDEEILAAARAVRRAERRTGHIIADACGAQGVLVGDGSAQHNGFGR